MNAPSLAICASNLDGSVPFAVALRLADGRILGQHSTVTARQELPAMIASLCAAAGLAAADLRELRIDLGPGSYTGLRVAVTFVRFLQHFGALPVLAVDSLALLSARARGHRRVVPLLDARRERFHVAAYATDSGARLHELEPAAAVPWPDVLARIGAGDVVVLSPALASLRGAELTGHGATVTTAAVLLAEELFAADLPFVAAPSEALEPRYLMGSYAE